MVAPDSCHPETYYLWAQDHAPVSWNPDLDAWVVAAPDLVREIVDDGTLFSTAHALPFLNPQPEAIEDTLAQGHRMARSIMSLDGHAHEAALPIWQKILHGPRINAYVPAMRHVAETLAADLPRQGQVDLVWDYAQPYVQQVLGELVGIPEGDRERMYQWSEDMLSYGNPLLPLEERIAAAQRHVQLDDYLVDLFNERRHHPTDDLTSVMATMTDLPGTPLSHADFFMILGTFYAAGVGSTRLTLNSAIQFTVDRDWWTAARTQPDVVPSIVEETLRRAPPQRGLLRTTTRDTVLGGVTMPAGTNVVPLFGSANLDQNRYHQPLAFDPHRPHVRDHLGFGGGLHTCVARHLGRTMARIGLHTLTQQVPYPQIHDLEYTASLIFYGPARQVATLRSPR